MAKWGVISGVGTSGAEFLRVNSYARVSTPLLFFTIIVNAALSVRCINLNRCPLCCYDHTAQQLGVNIFSDPVIFQS